MHSNSAPMIGRLPMHTGSACGWLREEGRNTRGYHRGDSVTRPTVDIERRALKRAERREAMRVSAEALAAIREQAAAVIADTWSSYEPEELEPEPYCTYCGTFGHVPDECPEREIDDVALYAAFEARTLAELAGVLDDATEAEQVAWEAAGWGDGIFSTGDLVWGYTVTTRP